MAVTTKANLAEFLLQWSRRYNTKLRAKIYQRGWTVKVWAPKVNHIDLYAELKPQLTCGVQLVMKTLRWWHQLKRNPVIVKEDY